MVEMMDTKVLAWINLLKLLNLISKYADTQHTPKLSAYCEKTLPSLYLLLDFSLTMVLIFPVAEYCCTQMENEYFYTNEKDKNLHICHFLGTRWVQPVSMVIFPEGEPFRTTLSLSSSWSATGGHSAHPILWKNTLPSHFSTKQNILS